MRHTVIIPSYNTLPHLKNTYQSIKRYGGDVNIIIISTSGAYFFKLSYVFFKWYKVLYDGIITVCRISFRIDLF